MSNNCDFQINQDGIQYIVNLSIIDNYLQVNCFEMKRNNNNEFFGQYTHEQIKQFSPLFNLTNSIQDDFEYFKQAIESQKVRIKRNVNNEIYLTFILEEEEVVQNQNIYLPLEFNNNLNNPNLEYSPVRRLPTIHVKMRTINIRRPTIYINGDESEIENNIINNNIYHSQVIRPLIPPINNKDIIHASTLTQINQKKDNYKSPQKVKTNINYYSPTNSPEREQIEYLNYGSPSKNQINYTSFRRNKKNASQNNIINNNIIPKVLSPASSPSTYYESRDEEIANEYINRIKKLENQYKENENKLNQIIYKLKKENEMLKIENKNLKGQIPKEDIDLVKKKLIDDNQKIINEFEQYRKQSEEKIISYESNVKNLLNKINILENENNKMKIEFEKLSKSQLYKRKIKLRLVKGEIIENNKELEFLTQRICKDHKKVTLNLLYKASVDSDKAEVFHSKCDGAKSTLVLVKSSNKKRFGGFTTCNWSGNGVEKNDENAFVFSFDKMKIYNIVQGELAIGCYPKYGPIFLGCQIRIYDNAFEKGGTTFEKGLNYNTEEDFELTGGIQNFGIEEVEVYGVEIE